MVNFQIGFGVSLLSKTSITVNFLIDEESYLQSRSQGVEPKDLNDCQSTLIWRVFSNSFWNRNSSDSIVSKIKINLAKHFKTFWIVLILCIYHSQRTLHYHKHLYLQFHSIRFLILHCISLKTFEQNIDKNICNNTQEILFKTFNIYNIAFTTVSWAETVKVRKWRTRIRWWRRRHRGSREADTVSENFRRWVV